MISVPRILDLSFRIIILIFALTAGLMFLFAGAKVALAANLRTVSVLSGDMLTVGDVFDGLSAEKAAYVLGPAPQPGKDMVLNANTLMRIAVALDLPWQPGSTADQIIVRRAATVIGADEIKTALTDRLSGEGIEERFTISFVSTAAPEMVLPQNLPATFDVATLDVDTQKDWFEATLMAPSQINPVAQITVTGKINRLVSVPVLKTTLRNGDIISAHDIAWVDVETRALQPDFVLKEEDLMGMTARRILESGKPVRDVELERPQIVGRGDAIVVVYQAGPLVLTTKGKALQSGAKGDFVRIVNMDSNRALEGFITAEREVTISE